MATRKTYTKAFKIEAVRLLGLGEKPASQLAQELGIRRNQLYKWRDQIEGKGEAEAFRGPGWRPASEEREIARLKRELERVREERDILKKAAAYFAKDLP